MGVVTKATYESLSDDIGNAYGSQRAAQPFIASGLEEIVNLDDADQEFDLLFTFYQANQGAASTFLSTTNFVALAAALNNHVELRSGKSLTEFLTDEGILVSEDFAVVSKDAGFDVDAFIEP
jgi:hypothetical protein